MKQSGDCENTAKKKHHACCETKNRIFVAPIAVDLSAHDGEFKRILLLETEKVG
jgi:hypothetical protein